MLCNRPELHRCFGFDRAQSVRRANRRKFGFSLSIPSFRVWTAGSGSGLVCARVTLACLQPIEHLLQGYVTPRVDPGCLALRQERPSLRRPSTIEKACEHLENKSCTRRSLFIYTIWLRNNFTFSLSLSETRCYPGPCYSDMDILLSILYYRQD